MNDLSAKSMAAERLKYILAVVIYGTIGMLLRFVSLPSELVALCRGVIGSGFILLYLKLRGEKLDREAIAKNRLWLILSGIFLGLNWIFLFAAYMTTTVAIASLCNYMAPLMVIVMAPAILRERLDRRKLPMIATAFIGIVLVSGVIGGGAGDIGGIAMGLLAAVCFSGIVICNRKLKDISSLDRSVVQLAVSAATILPYVLIRNIGEPLTVDLRSALIVLLLGAVHTGTAYCLYFSGMANLPVQTVAILGYLEPVVSVMCSALILNERMSLPGWLGAGLVIASAALSETIPPARSGRRES